MTPAQKVHEACHEACQACPQFRGYDDDQQFQIGGRWVEFGDIPKKGLQAVIAFWMDPNTEGGHLLFEMGYEAELPESIKQVFGRVNELLAQSIDQAIRECGIDC